MVAKHEGTDNRWGMCTVVDSAGVIKTFGGVFGESLAKSYNVGDVINLP